MTRFVAAARSLPRRVQILVIEYGVTVGLIAAVYYVAMAIRTH